MAKYKANELTPILAGGSGKPPPGGQPGIPPSNAEIWPQGQPPPPEPGAGGQSGGQPGGQPGKKPGKQPGKEPGKGPGKKPPDVKPGIPAGPGTGTLTDTEKVIGESDSTAESVIKKIYQEAQRKASQMSGKAGAEAGSSFGIFDTIMNAKINWRRLLKQKVKFFVDKVGKKTKTTGSYLMYPWKAQSQVGIIARGPLRQPKFGMIYMIFAFDTSGSITEDEMQAIVNELNSVADVFKRGKFTGKVFALEWDTAVHQFFEYKPTDKIKVYGGGGTQPKCLFDYIDSKIVDEKGKSFLLKLTDKDVITVKKLQGTKYTTAPFLVIFTDGDFGKLSQSSLGKIYGISKDNILYILTRGVKGSIYPPENYILYDKPRF